MADDLISALRSLANKWALKARDYSRDAKAEGIDADTAGYNRGFAEGYYRAATELAEVIKAQSGSANRSSAGSSMQSVTPPRPAAPPPPTPQAPPKLQPDAPNPNAGGRWGLSSTTFASDSDAPKPAQEPISSEGYVGMDLNEVLVMLQYSGTTPRDVQARPDNSFHAIFSRWESMTPAERVARVQKADLRLVVLASGFTKDTRDPFIDFAFKELG